MKRILMLGTGGTIACKHTESGLTPAITPEELVGFIPDVKDVCEVYTHQVCNVDSTKCNPCTLENDEPGGRRSL